MSDTSLDTLLTEDTGASQPAAAEPVAQEPSGVTHHEAAPPAASPSASVPDGYAPLAVVQDERKKRQEKEREVAEYQRKIREYEQQLNMRQQPQQQPPDWYAEPDKAAAVMHQHMQRELIGTRVSMSQAVMRQQYQDYDELEAVFAEAAEQQPHLWQQLYRHPMPAQFAYEQARKIKLMRDIGDDPEAYRQRIIAEHEASRGQQPQAQHQAPVRRSSPLPTSLGRAPSATPRDERNGRFTSRTELSDILDG